MNKMWIILTALSAMSCCVRGQKQEEPSITMLRPSGIGIYDIKCDLEYPKQSVVAILNHLESYYGFRFMSNIVIMDAHFEINLTHGPNDTQDLINVFRLCQENNVLSVASDPVDGLTPIGLSGNSKDIDNVLNILKDSYSITNITRSPNHIELYGKQVPFGEVIYRIAKASQLGIASQGSWLELSRNGRIVIAFTRAYPFYIYLSREIETGKIALDLLYDPHSLIKEINEVDIHEIVVKYRDKLKTISGHSVTATQNPVSFGRIEWISDEPVEWNDDYAISGTISGRMLHREYRVDNLPHTSLFADQGITIRESQISADGLISTFGHVWQPTSDLSGPLQGDLVCLEIETDGLLSPEERVFVRETEQRLFQQKGVPFRETGLSRQQRRAFDTLQSKKMTTIEVLSIGKAVDERVFEEIWQNNRIAQALSLNEHTQKYTNINLINYSRGFNTTKVFFDSIQNDKDVFPLGIHIREYQPTQVRFAISTVQSDDEQFQPVFKDTSLARNAEPEPYEVRTNSIGMELVWIPPGEFMMGSNLSEYELREKYLDDMSKDGGTTGWSFVTTEFPQHPVRITEGFWMGRYEVTQEQFYTISGKNPSMYRYKCSDCDTFVDPRDLKDEAFSESAKNHPVESVTRYQIMEFCRLLSRKEGKSYTLPTEAQWEYACRAGSTTPFSFGDDYDALGEYAWYKRNSSERTHPVGQKKPNAWGLYDMHGNVDEWCLDFYDPDFYSSELKIDPVNRRSPDLRYGVFVTRGGSIFCDNNCRSSARGYTIDLPDMPLDTVGFRVICWDLHEE